MHVSELPTGKLVGRTFQPVMLAKFLKDASRHAHIPFTHYDIISGAERSGRVLFQSGAKPSATAITLPLPFGAEDIASKFFNQSLLRESRFDPKEAPPGKTKCWEVLSTEDKQCVVVWTAWA